MASPVGGGGAYIRLQKPNEAISEGLKHWGSIAARQGAEFRARNERNQVRAQRGQEKADAQYDADMKAIEPVITGVSSVDEINYRAAATAQQRLGEIYEMEKSDPSKRNDYKLKMEKANLNSFPKTLAAIEKPLAENYKAFIKGYSEGTISEWDAEEGEKMQAFFGVKGKDGKMSPNYVIDFDGNGQMVAKGLTEDGKYFETSINELMNGSKFANFTKSTDSEVYSKDIATGLGKDQRLKVSRGFQSVIQDFSTQEGKVRELVRASLGDSDNPTDLAKSTWADENNMGRNRADFKEGSLKQIEDFLVNKISSKYDRTVTGNKQLRKEDTSTSNKGASGNISLMKDHGTGGSMEITLSPNTNNSTVSGFSLKKPVTIGIGDKKKIINRLYLSKDGGVFFRGKEQTTESGSKSIGGITIGGSSKKETTYRDITEGGLSSQELNEIANSPELNLKDANALKTHLEKVLNEEGGAPQSTEKQGSTKEADPLGIL